MTTTTKPNAAALRAACNYIDGTTDGLERLAQYIRPDSGIYKLAQIIDAEYSPLVEACAATVETLAGSDLPDNGELSGAAVSDWLRAELAKVRGNYGD